MAAPDRLTRQERYLVHQIHPAMAVGGWRRRPALIAAGLALVGLGWSHGLLPARSRPARQG